MVLGLRTFLIFFVFGSVAIAKRPKDVLKNTRKRFIDTILGGSIQKITWNFMSDEEFNRTQNEQAQKIATFILKQSSVENGDWKESADIVESLMSSYFEGAICGGPRLNYVQFMNYWKRQRQQYKKNTDQNLEISFVKSDSYTRLTFMLAFKQHSKWGFSATAVYMVQLALRGANEHSSYTIISIDEIGACTEYGKVDWMKTELYQNLHIVSDNHLERRKKVVEHVDSLFITGKPEEVIPFNWLKSAARHEFFTAEVCHDGVLKQYTKYQFIRWWQKFQVMWHPVKDQEFHTNVQLIGGHDDRYVFRVTMNLQLGAKPKREIQEVNFKLQIQYNVHGDELWYINKFEVMCPQYSEKKLMEMHAEVYKEVIGARMQKMIDNPGMWFTCTNVFDDLISKDEELEFESCEGRNGEKTQKVNRLAALEFKLWEANKASNVRMEGYDLGVKHESSPVGESMWMKIFPIWTPIVEGETHESQWMIHMKWNPDLQFFTIYKIWFGCPYSRRGYKRYVILRRYG